jgi:hypothetical protein
LVLAKVGVENQYGQKMPCPDMWTFCPKETPKINTCGPLVRAIFFTTVVMHAEKEIPQVKLILIGNGGVGKSSLINHHLTEEFNMEAVQTKGVEVHPIIFYTNPRPIRFVI